MNIWDYYPEYEGFSEPDEGGMETAEGFSSVIELERHLVMEEWVNEMATYLDVQQTLNYGDPRKDPELTVKSSFIKEKMMELQRSEVHRIRQSLIDTYLSERKILSN